MFVSLATGQHLETNPPAYYLLLHHVIGALGQSALAVRMTSVLLSTLTVLVVYALGCVTMDRSTARLAAIFAAINPTSIFFAQEARPCALAGLFECLPVLPPADRHQRRAPDLASQSGCLALARTSTAHPGGLARMATGTAVATLLLVGLAHERLVATKEDWPEAARLARAAPECRGPLLIGGASGLGLIYYAPDLASRPFTTVIPAHPGTMTAELTLMQIRLHPSVIDEAHLAEVLRSTLNAMLIARGRFQRAEPPSVRDELGRAKLHRARAGNLTVDCSC